MSHRRGSSLSSLPLWAKISLGVAATLAIGAALGIANERSLPDLDAEARNDRPQPGDVLLFYRPRRGRDYFIRWLTRSPFYHAALFESDGYVVEARAPQVSGATVWRVATMASSVVPAHPGTGEKALAWAKTQIGDHFDRKDFLVIFLEHIFVGWHINYAPPGRYTCAELVTASSRHAGFDPFPGREDSEIDPADWAKYLPK